MLQHPVWQVSVQLSYPGLMPLSEVTVTCVAPRRVAACSMLSGTFAVQALGWYSAHGSGGLLQPPPLHAPGHSVHGGWSLEAYSPIIFPPPSIVPDQLL